METNHDFFRADRYLLCDVDVATGATPASLCAGYPAVAVCRRLRAEGALSTNLLWTAVAMVYFSIKYNEAESMTPPVQSATNLGSC